MNITKNQWIAIGVVGAVAVWYFFLRKKDTKESGYDNNLMIFGNENGYTNYQLDGGMLESGYGPGFGAYGSYGNESGYLVGCSKQECAAAGLTPGGNGCCYKTSKAMTAPKGGSKN